MRDASFRIAFRRPFVFENGHFHLAFKQRLRIKTFPPKIFRFHPVSDL